MVVAVRGLRGLRGLRGDEVGAVGVAVRGLRGPLGDVVGAVVVVAVRGLRGLRGLRGDEVGAVVVAVRGLRAGDRGEEHHGVEDVGAWARATQSTWADLAPDGREEGRELLDQWQVLVQHLERTEVEEQVLPGRTKPHRGTMKNICRGLLRAEDGHGGRAEAERQTNKRRQTSKRHPLSNQA